MRYGQSTKSAPGWAIESRRAMWLVAVVIGVMVVALTQGVSPSFAQGECLQEREPNDSEQDASLVSGPFCLEGALTSADQDFKLWEVRAQDVTTRWTIELQGVPGTLTLLKVFVVTSQPDQTPVKVKNRSIIEITVAPEDREAAIRDDLLLPAGRYLIAVTRSAVLGGGQPSTEAYRYLFEAGEPLPLSADIEPNDDPATARGLADAFEVSGDLGGSSDDLYSWTVNEPGRRWSLELEVPLTQVVSLDLETVDGRSLASASTDTVAQFEARLYDLALDVGTYVIRLRRGVDHASPYVLRALVVDADGDPEPNDQTADAVPIRDGEPARGRLAAVGDEDRFALTVPPGEPMLREIRLLWRSDIDRKLCLLDDADRDIVCRQGKGGLTLPNLVLTPGRHTLQVRGKNDASDRYLLRVDAIGPAALDIESEPNDEVESATTLDPSLDMRARGSEGDEDYFRLRLEGEPQLWRFDLAGSGIGRFDLVRPNGFVSAKGDIGADGSTASLTDLYLVPGEHWLRARTSGPEYTLQSTALGPPDPDGEREPNDEAARAQRYRIGTRRVGRLPTASDRDFYRFTLAAPQRIRIDLGQPADARTALRLSARNEHIAELQGLPAGVAIAWDLSLEPGDYTLELEPEQWSDGTYELTSERLDAFALLIDQEPNDDPESARAIPRSLAWTGSAGYPGDEDWFVLPPLTSDELLIDVTGEDTNVRLGVAGAGSGRFERIELARMPEGTFASSEHPPGAPLVLMVQGDGEYRVELSGAGLVAMVEPVATIEMSWQVNTDEVAAYWPEEQLIESSLELTNTGADGLELKLDATTSHYLWQANLAAEAVNVPAGTTIMVPVTIVVGADAWGAEPVLVSARATSPDGAQASASVSISTSAEAMPVNPRLGWSVPDELLGGLNAASLAFGAIPGGTLSEDTERRLFDGVTPQGSRAIASPVSGNGFRVFITDHVEELPIEMTVDLAGEEAVPVVGTIINIQAGEGDLREVPRDFELLLSRDGLTWVPALVGTLSSLSIDQAFVLDEPVDATHAMLRITSKYGDQGGFLALGEWKVVVAPGTAVSAGPINVADPAHGGHLVSIEPMGRQPDVGTLLLDNELQPDALDIDAGARLSLVIGFRDGRAALVDRLEWRDPQSSNPDERLEQLDVEVSLRSPTGPWRPIGSWELERAADGSVKPFTPAGSTWVRFLRLSGSPPSEARAMELPATISVLERKADEDYRSIVGEWGYRSAPAVFEWLDAAPANLPEPSADAGDGMAAATPLTAGAWVVDRVEIDTDEDWFGIIVPEAQNTLEIKVDGRPTVRVGLSLFDDKGEERPMAFRIGDDGSVTYQAGVESEARYTLRVVQPPFSATFAFDTSGSIDPFLEMVTQGMQSFLTDVQPGREVVTLLPFEEPALLDGWQDDPYVLGAAFDRYVSPGQGSSGAEAALIDASELLAEREGGRAILLVTDAETSTAGRTPELWDQLARVRPIIFSVHIGALREPLRSRQLMQDWAASGGGYYSYPTTAGEMDRAFDRMATWLRRPADYTLSYETLNLGPSTLGVRAPASGGVAGLAPGVGIEIILDTSGSMLDKLGGKRRIDIARESLRSLVGEALAEDVPVAVRTFGGKGKKKAARCQTRLSSSLAPLDRADMLRLIDKLAAKKKTKTPIAAALAAVADDLAAVTGPRSVVLVTDGAETCGGDPAAAIEALRAAGIDLTLNIVGFALDDETLKAQMAAWAEAGNGTYFDAAGADELATSLASALKAPFRVYGPDGEIFEGGTVDGAPITIDPGTYRVEVLVDPPLEFSEVVVEAGASVTLELPAAE